MSQIKAGPTFSGPIMVFAPVFGMGTVSASAIVKLTVTSVGISSLVLRSVSRK